MSATTLIVFAALFALFFPLEWRRQRSQAARNPEWEKAMRATPRRDRQRISRAVRRGQRLDNPREAQLAVGMAEQQQLVNRSLRGLPKVNLAFGTALAALGLLAGVATVAILGLVFVAVGLAETNREGRRRKRLDQAEQANREQAALETNRQGK